MKSMSNNSTFDLQKYLIENKLTTNSKLLSEIKIEPEMDTGRRNLVIEIKWGAHGFPGNIKEHYYYGDFETYCYERGEQILEEFKERWSTEVEDTIQEYTIGKPFFNADKTACDIASYLDVGYIYVQSHTLEEDVRDKLLDEETPYYEINDIIDSLGIEYFNNDEQ